MKPRKANKNDPLICLCNEVPLSTIRDAMNAGACTLAALFDATWAGCGPCGGSCQPQLVELLRQHFDAHSRRGGP